MPKLRTLRNARDCERGIEFEADQSAKHIRSCAAESVVGIFCTGSIGFRIARLSRIRQARRRSSISAECSAGDRASDATNDDLEVSREGTDWTWRRNMNRRSAILSTICGLFGLAITKPTLANVAIQSIVERRCNGIVFSEDVTGFRINRHFELTEDGRSNIVTQGYVGVVGGKAVAWPIPFVADIAIGYKREHLELWTIPTENRI